MKDTLPTYRTIAFETLLATSVCMCVGLLFYGTSVLTVHSHKFVFISNGVTGALTFYTLRRLRPRDTIIFLLVILLFQGFFLTKSFIYGMAAMDIVFYAAVPAAVAVFFWSYRKHRNEVKPYDPLILALFVAAMIAVARTVFLIKMTFEGSARLWSVAPLPLLNEAVESLLIGAGLGMGFWLIDLPGVKTALHLTKGYTSRPT